MGQSILLVLLAGWAGYLALARLAGLVTKPRPVRPGPASPDLPDDLPPAVVGYLVNACRVDPDAAVATLLDLAARRHLEFYQPGDDPEQTLVRVRDPAMLGPAAATPAALTPYERRVLDRVVAAAGPAGVVKLSDLSSGYAAEGYRWSGEFRAEVVADVKGRGLLRDGPFGLSVIVMLVGVLLACGSGILLPADLFGVGHDLVGSAGDFGTGRGVALIATVVLLSTVLLVAALYPVMQWLDAPHRSAAGRAVTARWLGVSAWLRAHPDFTELPPAAVTVWDRYLSYAAALGVTPVISRTADLAVGGRELLWSRYTGTWRQVRVRYPGAGRRSGLPPLTIVLNNLAALGLLALLAWFAREWYAAEPPPVRYVVASLLGLVALRSLYRTARAMLDRLRPVDITGEVIARSTVPMMIGIDDMSGPMSGWARRRIRPERTQYFVVVDDGRAATTVVWTVYPGWRRAGQCARGDVVRLRGYRWCRFARNVTVLEPAGRA
jgi:hypothetical protein